MARIGFGVLLLLATSCAAVQAAPPSTAAMTACTFGDFRSCVVRCARGSAESCNNAGAHYELGSGVTRDVDAAARFYARACDAGAAAACENGERVRAAKLAASVVASRVEPPSDVCPTPTPIATAAPTPTPIATAHPMPTPTATPHANDPYLTSDALGRGTFASTGGMLGTWSSTAGSCFSGVSQSVLGTLSWAKFEDSHGGDDRSLMLHAEAGKVYGIEIQRFRPFRSVDLSRQQCSRFDTALREQADGSMAADVELDCTTTDGGRVTASIHGAACGSR